MAMATPPVSSPQVFKKFIKKPDWIAVENTKDKILQNGDFWRELSSECQTLSLKKSVVVAALGAMLNDKKAIKAWPRQLRDDEKARWIEEVNKRVRSHARVIMQTMNKAPDSLWLAELFNPGFKDIIGAEDFEAELAADEEDCDEADGADEDCDEAEDEESEQEEEAEDCDESEHSEVECKPGAKLNKKSDVAQVMQKPAAASAASSRSGTYIFGLDIEHQLGFRVRSDDPKNRKELADLWLAPRDGMELDEAMTAKWEDGMQHDIPAMTLADHKSITPNHPVSGKRAAPLWSATVNDGGGRLTIAWRADRKPLCTLRLNGDQVLQVTVVTFGDPLQASTKDKCLKFMIEIGTEFQEGKVSRTGLEERRNEKLRDAAWSPTSAPAPATKAPRTSTRARAPMKRPAAAELKLAPDDAPEAPSTPLVAEPTTPPKKQKVAETEDRGEANGCGNNW